MQWNNKYFGTLIIAVAGILIFSCKEKTVNEVVMSSETPTYETEEFLTFYDRFGKDSTFQMDHTVFPLEGMKSLKDSLDVPDPNFRWTADHWVMHKPYDDMGGTFAREFMDLNGLVIERIGDPSGRYTLERRFGKLSSGWHLIYYRELGIY